MCPIAAHSVTLTQHLDARRSCFATADWPSTKAHGSTLQVSAACGLAVLSGARRSAAAGVLGHPAAGVCSLRNRRRSRRMHLMVLQQMALVCSICSCRQFSPRSMTVPAAWLSFTYHILYDIETLGGCCRRVECFVALQRCSVASLNLVAVVQ